MSELKLCPVADMTDCEFITRFEEIGQVLHAVIGERIIRCEECKWSVEYNDEYMRCQYPFPMTEQGIFVKRRDYCCHCENPDLGIVKS